MQNAGLDEAQAGIKIAWRNINDLRYADDTTLMGCCSPWGHKDSEKTEWLNSNNTQTTVTPSPQGSREQEATAERKPDAEHELQGAAQDQHPGSYLYL